MNKMQKLAKAVGGKWVKKGDKNTRWSGLDTATKSGKELRITQSGDGTSAYDDETLEVNIFSAKNAALLEGQMTFSNGIPDHIIIASLKELLKL